MLQFISIYQYIIEAPAKKKDKNVINNLFYTMYMFHYQLTRANN
jgi:hypothetical protein